MLRRRSSSSSDGRIPDSLAFNSLLNHPLFGIRAFSYNSQRGLSCPLTVPPKIANPLRSASAGRMIVSQT